MGDPELDDVVNPLDVTIPDLETDEADFAGDVTPDLLEQATGEEIDDKLVNALDRPEAGRVPDAPEE